MNYNSIKSNYGDNGETSIKLINDFPQKPIIKANQLNEMNIKPDILNAIYFHKSVLIGELRAADIKNSGLISFNEIVLAFVKAYIHPELTSQLISDIVSIYNPIKSDKIDYMKLISYFLMDLKGLIELKKSSLASSQNLMNASIPETGAFSNLKGLSKTGSGFYNSNTSKGGFPKLILQNSKSNFNTETNSVAEGKLHSKYNIFNIILFLNTNKL